MFELVGQTQGEESTYPQRGTVREFIKRQSAII